MGDRPSLFLSINGIDKSCEPPVGYAATGSGYANTMELETDVPQAPVGSLGFYTNDPDVFEARIAEIEAEVERAEQGMPEIGVVSYHKRKDVSCPTE